VTAAHPERVPAPPLQRDGERGVLGGVCAGLARRLGIEPLPIRIIALVLALAGGIGVPLYLLAWAAMPGDSSARGLGRSRRSAVEVALGVGLLAISAMLALRGMGLWISDAVTWPLALVAGGVALLWRGGIGARPPAPAERAPVAAVPAPVEPAERVVNVSRQGLGAALLVAAGLVFLQATGSLSAARDVILAALVVTAVLALIFAPWTLRMARSLTVERAERIRSQERAELAAHLHDSVLQTLALMQKRADDPREVAALARAQERELRAWLAGRSPAEGERSLAAALEAAAADVEARHRVPVDVIAVGDADLDAAGEALVAATREAMVNAAKFGEGSPVAVYAEATDDALQVFVRDRGPGFDPAAVPADRRGLRESVVGRMARHGGHATVTAAPGAGTEVELTLDRTP
jgi:phage shock protein PspC (stress-responsive transcriptional regulator)/signal transduction histidine kinase